MEITYFYQLARELSKKVQEELLQNASIYKNRINDKLADIFTEHINLGSGNRNTEYFIEHLTSEYYFPELKRQIDKIQNAIEDQISEEFDILVMKVEGEQESIENSFRYFVQGVNNILKRVTVEPFESINEEFLQIFKSASIRKFEPLGNEAEDLIKFDITPNVRRYLERVSEEIAGNVHYSQFAKKLYMETASEIEKYKNVEKEEKKEDTKTTLSIEQVNYFAELFNCKLEKKENGYYLTNSSGLSSPVTITKNGLTFDRSRVKGKVTNDKVSIQYLDDRVVFIGPDYVPNRKVTYFKDGSITIESLISSNVFGINNNNGVIEYNWNGKIQDNPEAKHSILWNIQEKYGNIYKQMCSNPSFASSFEKVEKENEEYQIIGDGLKINDKYRDELRKRLLLVNYEMEEVNGEIFLTNTITGVKDKLIESKNGLVLQNNPNIMFDPDLIILANKIQTKCFQFRENNSSIIISSNFRYFGYLKNGKHYRITIGKEGLEYSGDMSPEEIQKTFETDFPNIMAYIKANVKWEEYNPFKKEKSGEELLDEKIKELEQDPKIKAYLELLQLKSEMIAKRENQNNPDQYESGDGAQSR